MQFLDIVSKKVEGSSPALDYLPRRRDSVSIDMTGKEQKTNKKISN